MKDISGFLLLVSLVIRKRVIYACEYFCIALFLAFSLSNIDTLLYYCCNWESVKVSANTNHTVRHSWQHLHTLFPREVKKAVVAVVLYGH